MTHPLEEARGEALARVAALDPPDDEHDPEGATIAYERQLAAALLDDARRDVAEVDAALERVRDGTYGTCERCGRPIAAERLDARPTARTCVGCADRR